MNGLDRLQQIVRSPSASIEAEVAMLVARDGDHAYGTAREFALLFRSGARSDLSVTGPRSPIGC